MEGRARAAIGGPVWVSCGCSLSDRCMTEMSNSDGRIMFFLPTLGRNRGLIYMSDPISHQEAKQRWCKDHFIVPRAHIIFSPLQDSTSTWIKSVRPWAGGGKAGSPTRFWHSSIKQFWKIAINMHAHNTCVWKYYDQKHNFFFFNKRTSAIKKIFQR